jgi:ribonuclease HI
MYFDGSYTLKGAGASVVLIPPKGDVLKYAIQLEFSATNNIMEYKGLVNGPRYMMTPHQGRCTTGGQAGTEGV